MKSFEEFRELWEIEAQNPAHAIDELDHLIFIVMYPDNLEWSFIVEKQMQTTCLTPLELRREREQGIDKFYVIKVK